MHHDDHRNRRMRRLQVRVHPPSRRWESEGGGQKQRIRFDGLLLSTGH
jgi:hypothetical protein